MTCAHLITNGSLVCTRTDEHDPDARGGHCYDAGNWMNDKHGEQGHG